MNLGELLDELRNNILHDRSDRISGSSDYLWTDETLIRYINEAQRRFARHGLILRDGTTSDVTQFTLVEGQSEYALHPAVLAVMSAKRVGDVGDMKRAGHAALDTYQQPDPYFFDPNQLSALQPGKPIAYTTDEYLSGDDYDSLSTTTMRVYPTPSAEFAGDTIKMRVIRLPVDPLTRLNQYPEIPEDHHLEMLDWAAYLALRIVDHDAGNPGRAHEFRSMFENSVRAARNSAMRKMFTPLQWGFGRNGFSWEN